jgi:hypothetical protein
VVVIYNVCADRMPAGLPCMQGAEPQTRTREKKQQCVIELAGLKVLFVWLVKPVAGLT